MKRLGILSSILLLCACHDVSTPDGRVPAKYLDQAKKLVGTYVGQFEGVTTTLNLTFDVDRPVVMVINDQGNDLLGPACHSTVGLMKSFSGDDSGLQSVKFAFDPGACTPEIEGKDITFEFHHNYTQVLASILEGTQWGVGCLIAPATPPAPYPTPPPCQPQQTDVYLQGAFTRN